VGDDFPRRLLATAGGLGPTARRYEERDREPAQRTAGAGLEQWRDHAEVPHIERAFQLFRPHEQAIPALAEPGGSTSPGKTEPTPGSAHRSTSSGRAPREPALPA